MFLLVIKLKYFLITSIALFGFSSSRFSFLIITSFINSLTESLTLTGLGSLENLRAGREARTLLVSSQWKILVHAVSQKILVYFIWNFVHILYWQYGICLDKKLTNVTFIIIWSRHHESGFLSFLGIDLFFIVKWVWKVHRKQVVENNFKKLIIILQYRKIFQKINHFDHGIKIYRIFNFTRITFVKKWWRQQ